MDTVFSTQLTKLETRFEAHADKMEERMDQIVDLMKLVAQLQERDIHQTQDIQKLEVAMIGTKLGNDDLVKKLFSKYDNILEAFTEHEKADVVKHDLIFTEVRTNKAAIDEVLNKGSGVWKTLCIVGIILQIIFGAFGAVSLNALFESHKENAADKAMMEKRMSAFELHHQHDEEMLNALGINIKGDKVEYQNPGDKMFKRKNDNKNVD